MKRVEIIVDTFDEFTEVERGIESLQSKNKYSSIEIYCREVSHTFIFEPSENGENYTYFKIEE